MTLPLTDLVAQLRVGASHESYDVSVQRLYESALKRDRWNVRFEAMPLLIGVDPESWPDYLKQNELTAFEAALWERLADGLDMESDVDLVAVEKIVNYFRANGITLPVCFTRLYDFIRQSAGTSQRTGDPGVEPNNDAAAAQMEKELVLGAALAVVAKMPERCRDEHGFIDGKLVTQLILRTAVRWFPTRAPAMSADDMARLIDKWLE